MDIVLILKIIIGILSFLFGLLSILRPQVMADFAHFGLSDSRGLAETRINFGGFYIAVGIGVIILNAPPAWMLLGFGYAGLASVRLINGLVDRSLFDQVYLVTLAFEVISAIILLLPMN